MICCENIVKILWTQHFFFNSFPDFSNHYFILFFFLPFSAMPLPQLLFFFLFPYFGNGIATISFSQFFFSSYFGNVIATIRFSQLFFFSLFRQCHCHKFFFPPYFDNDIVTISLSHFFPLFQQYHCHNQFVTNFFLTNNN